MALIQGGTAVPKAVAKLIDTIGDQIGLFLEPTHIRKKGQAEAEVLVYEAKAKAEISALKMESKLAIQSIQDRAAERVRKREEKRQANLEAITSQAARELPEAVSDTPVDDDWTTQFFNHSQDVSNQQMQTLWARLLAGEVAKPGSFSLRTLGIVKVMSKDDANLFTRFCSTMWQTPIGLWPIIPTLDKLTSFPNINLKFTDLVRLDALGLIRFDPVAGFSLKSTKEIVWTFHYYGKQHLISKKDALVLETGNAMLTNSGNELAVVAGSMPDEECQSSVIAFLRQHGWTVEVLESAN